MKSIILVTGIAFAFAFAVLGWVHTLEAIATHEEAREEYLWRIYAE